MSQNKKLNIAFAGGGSGGHVMPISSLIRYIYKSEKYSDLVDNIFWFGQKGQMEEKEFEKICRDDYLGRQKIKSELRCTAEEYSSDINNESNLSGLIIDNNTNTENIQNIKSILLQKGFTTIDVISREDFDFGKQDNYDIYILSGGHGNNIKTANHLEFYDNEIELLKSDKNIVGICLGMQIIAKYFGSNIIKGDKKIEGNIYINYNNNKYEVIEAHNYIIDKLGEDLEGLAESEYGYEIIKHKNKNIYGLQFHPEKYNRIQDGDEIFESIIDEINGGSEIYISNGDNIDIDEKLKLFIKVISGEPRNDDLTFEEAKDILSSFYKKEGFFEGHGFDSNIYIGGYFTVKLKGLPFEFENKIAKEEFIKKVKYIYKNFDTDKTWNLRNLYIDNNKQGKGNGNKLLQDYEKKVIDQGGKYSILSTLNDKGFQKERYKRNGYKVFWEVENYGHDLVFMIKELKSENSSSVNNKDLDKTSLVPTTFLPILSGKLRRQPDFKEILLNIADIFKFVIGIFQSLWYIYINKIDVVFCKGGYVALPAVFAAKILGRRILVHESDTKSGLVNKIAARFADKVYTGFPGVLAREQVVGQIISDNIVPSENPSTQSDKTTILVNLGSLGSASVHDALLDIFNKFPNVILEYEWHIILGSLNADYEDKYQNVIDKVAINRASAKSSLHIYTFVDQKVMGELLYKTDISICRGGTTSLAEQKMFGIKQLIIPIPRTHDQAKNADYYVDHHQDIYIKQDKSASILGDNIYKEIIGLNNFRKIQPDLNQIKQQIETAKKIICDEVFGL